MKYQLYIAALFIMSACGYEPVEESVEQENLEAIEKDDYPTGNEQLILDSWQLRMVSSSDTTQQQYIDSVNQSKMIINLRQKGKTVISADPFIQWWGTYQVDENYNSISLHFPKDNIKSELEIIMLNKDTLVLSGRIDSSTTENLKWKFVSMGNKF